MRDAQWVASSGRVDVFQHGVDVDSALAGVADTALSRMEAMLHRKLDESTLGPRIHIYVSSSTTISHVWRGYRQPHDPKGVVFLSARVAAAAMQGTNATYAHELAHLINWRFHSHTLREGLADYLALQLHPDAGIGPNVQGYALPPSVEPEIEEYLGTTKPPPQALMTRPDYRRGYYYASYRFVRYLIERAGMAIFLMLYDAQEPENEYPRLYGADRKELVAAAAK